MEILTSTEDTIDCVREVISDRKTLVIGSAPSARYDIECQEEVCRICVNGAISAAKSKVGRNAIPVDIWALNSREYDKHPFTGRTPWSPKQVALHEAMMSQGHDIHVKHLLLLLRNKRPDQTIDRLKKAGVSWDTISAVHARQRIEINQEAGIQDFHLAYSLSAGLCMACIALLGGGNPVLLGGFSFDPGYCYVESVPDNSRKHVLADQTALKELFHHYSSRLVVMNQPEQPSH